MGRFLKFEKMITPFFIQVIFWIGTIIIIIVGLLVMLGGFLSNTFVGEAIDIGSDGKVIGFIIGLLIIIVGPILLRIYCEMLIVIFKLQGAMLATRDLLIEQNDLVRKGGYRPPPPPPAPREPMREEKPIRSRSAQPPPAPREPLQEEKPTRARSTPPPPPPQQTSEDPNRSHSRRSSDSSNSDIPPEFLE